MQTCVEIDSQSIYVPSAGFLVAFVARKCWRAMIANSCHFWRVQRPLEMATVSARVSSRDCDLWYMDHSSRWFGAVGHNAYELRVVRFEVKSPMVCIEPVRSGSCLKMHKLLVGRSSGLTFPMPILRGKPDPLHVTALHATIYAYFCKIFLE
jgi:hypothetical protein